MNVLKLQPVLAETLPSGMLRLDYASSVDGLTDWALLLPGRRPDLWIVVLHGHGARGDQLYSRHDLRERWLPEFLKTGGGILTLNLRGNAWMGPAAAIDLHDVIGFLRTQFGMRRTVFCSGSMGATSNLIYGILHPEDVNAIVARGAATDLATYYPWCRSQTRPILSGIAEAINTAYGAEPNQAPELYRRHSALANAESLRMPVYLAHGEADATIPVEQARWLAEKLHGRRNFAYHEIPGGNHDSPLRDMWGLDWVLQRIGYGFST